MIEINSRQLIRLEHDLKRFAHEALPFATNATINRAAFETMKQSKKNVSEKMTERNTWSRRSIQFEKSRTLKINNQESATGSTLDYMRDQEYGTTRTRDGKEGVPIPTGYAANQEGANPRTRAVRAARRVSRIRLRKTRTKGRSRAQTNFLRVREAARTGRKFIFLDLSRRKGVFRVEGGRENTKVKMVHDLSRQSIRIPARPWLQPAVDKIEPRMTGFYADALRFQLKRRGLF